MSSMSSIITQTRRSDRPWHKDIVRPPRLEHNPVFRPQRGLLGCCFLSLESIVCAAMA
jgi:hypothetical protein